MTGILIDTQLDPLGSIIAEARADTDLDALLDGRIRGGEPKPRRVDPTTLAVLEEGDALGPGHYKAFIVLTLLDAPVHPQLPISLATEYGVNCYGVTFQNATEVWLAFRRAFHKVRTRTKANGLGIYGSTIVTGGSQDRDQDTKQPIIRGVLRVLHTTSSVLPPGS